MRFIRSLVFNLVFYAWTALLCVALIWTIVLPPRWLLWELRTYLASVAFLERAVLGLDFRVLDREKVPEGPFILAAKHQSTWETFKLHGLFGEPVIIVKKELMRIPIWGWFLKRAFAISIDRASGARAVREIVDRARPHIEAGRPIVIFPQGTRTAPGHYRPYQIGVFALYKTLKLPVVPMALNSGLFWPRHKFVKTPGTITVRFLDPIPPGLDRKTFMTRLEEVLEQASERLVLDAGGPPTKRPAYDPRGRGAAGPPDQHTG